MEYSAASAKFLLWFIETRETIRLLYSGMWKESMCLNKKH